MTITPLAGLDGADAPLSSPLGAAAPPAAANAFASALENAFDAAGGALEKADRSEHTHSRAVPGAYKKWSSTARRRTSPCRSHRRQLQKRRKRSRRSSGCRCNAWKRYSRAGKRSPQSNGRRHSRLRVRRSLRSQSPFSCNATRTSRCFPRRWRAHRSRKSPNVSPSGTSASSQLPITCAWKVPRETIYS